MSRTPFPTDERLLDLLSARATQGLSDAETRELDGMAAEHAETEIESIELAAAAADLAMMGALEPMPEHVRQRLQANAARWMTGTASPRKPRPQPVDDVVARIEPGRPPLRRGSRWMSGAGWIVAAACLALAFAGWWPHLTATPAKPPLSTQLDQFVQSTPDAIRAPWGDFNDLTTGQPPEIPGVQGEVIWSDAEQRGFMVLTGLPVNNPAREQYQLWIVDAERGIDQRISGAVFDVPAGSGRVVVPIDPQLKVNQAAVFAVTIEKPGGVWVSDMTRRACLAAVRG